VLASHNASGDDRPALDKCVATGQFKKKYQRIGNDDHDRHNGAMRGAPGYVT
jgi:hypothetical protein